MTLDNILLVTTGTLTAILAGIYFGYSVSVIGALRRLKDVEYVRTMQALNFAIENPLFFLTFMGPFFLLPVVTFMHRGDGNFALLLAASITYIVASFGLTMGGNVPLNEKLKRFKLDGASDSEITAIRTAVENPWNKLHNIRTFASVVATVLVFAACLTR